MFMFRRWRPLTSCRHLLLRSIETLAEAEEEEEGAEAMHRSYEATDFSVAKNMDGFRQKSWRSPPCFNHAPSDVMADAQLSTKLLLLLYNIVCLGKIQRCLSIEKNVFFFLLWILCTIPNKKRKESNDGKNIQRSGHEHFANNHFFSLNKYTYMYIFFKC